MSLLTVILKPFIAKIKIFSSVIILYDYFIKVIIIKEIEKNHNDIEL